MIVTAEKYVKVYLASDCAPFATSTASNSEVTTTSSEEQIALKQKSILVAEDNAINRKVIAKMLQQLNINYSLACNGKEALQATETTQFDLILMDVCMPVMDGLEAATELKKRDSSIPIVFITATPCERVQQTIREIGVNGLMHKPFTMQDLTSVISKHSL